MKISRTPIINSGDPEDKRVEIKNYFNETYDVYEKLFNVITEDGYYARPDRLRHPLIFYFGHTATFFVNKLHVSKIIEDRVNPELESMLAIGVDEMSWDDLDEKNYEWPAIEDVREYRNQVRELVNGLIDTLPLDVPIRWDDPFWIILMGIEHERIHLETSSVLIRQLPMEMVQTNIDWQSFADFGSPAPDNVMLKVTAGTVKQGKGDNATTYGWDNEYG